MKFLRKKKFSARFFDFRVLGGREEGGGLVIGGAPAMLDRRRSLQLLYRERESSIRHCEAWYKPWPSPTVGFADSEGYHGTTELRASNG